MTLMSNIELQHHADAVIHSGYSILRDQVSSEDCAMYLGACERAVSARIDRCPPDNPVCAADCLYTWDPRVLKVLEHPSISGLTQLLLGKCKLFNLSAQVALPESQYGTGMTKEDYERSGDFWHRDFDPEPEGARLQYLWHFVCLVDVGPSNGATWLVPGTNHACEGTPVRGHGAPVTFPDAVQFEARAGDVVVIDPTMWHEIGHNYTETPRWILFAGFCGQDKPAQRNHWQIASQGLCRDMNNDVRGLFVSTDGPDDGTKSVPPCLPDGWPK